MLEDVVECVQTWANISMGLLVIAKHNTHWTLALKVCLSGKEGHFSHSQYRKAQVRAKLTRALGK